MASEVFLDTSGLFAHLVPRDPLHLRARRIVKRIAREGRRLITTDYILDETATLLKARGYAKLLPGFFDHVFGSSACTVHWTDAELFAEAQAFILKHQDQDWSFTDCLSFVRMRAFRLREALTSDAHFEAAGFVALLK